MISTARDGISCVWLSGTRIPNSPLFPPSPSPPLYLYLSLVFSHSVIRLSQLAPRRRYRPTYYPPLRVYSTTPPLLFSFSAPSRCANALELPSILPMLPPSLCAYYYVTTIRFIITQREHAIVRPRTALIHVANRARRNSVFPAAPRSSPCSTFYACENFISFNSLIKIPYTKSPLGIAI
jgi:hypothetical protein